MVIHPIARDTLRRVIAPLSTLSLSLALCPPAHAVTSISVDGRTPPIQIVVGETVTLRFDVSKAGGSAQVTMARDLSTTGVWDPSFPNRNSFGYTDGGNDADPVAGKVAVPISMGVGVSPAGRYFFVVQDTSDSSVRTLPFTLSPKPEAQSISGRVAVVSDANPAGVPPPDAVIWAFSDPKTPVASAAIRPDGSYTLPVPPGTYILFAEWFGSLRSERKLCPIAAGVPLQNVNLPLLKAQEVTGRVMSGGNPSADVVVQATAADGKAFAARTFTDGTYTLVLPAGQDRIAAPGGSENVTVSDQPIDGVDFPPATEGPAPAKGTIVTVAGNGLTGLGGDGRRATSARLTNTNHIALDRQGNLYLVDFLIHRARVVRGGIITRVAGIANPEAIRGLTTNYQSSGGFSGDDGPATAAQLSACQCIVVDAAGNLYIGDTANHRVRKVDTRGIITTVAGSGPVDMLLGTFEGDGGPATAARLSRPNGVAVDAAGNLFIGDARNRRIRKVDTNGIITTVAGGGTAAVTEGAVATSVALGSPSRVALDRNGNLFILDSGLNRILKLSPAGTLSIVAGNGTAGFSGDGGPATAAQFNTALGITVDSAGNLFIADAVNNRVRKVDPNGIISTVAGAGSSFGFSGDGGPATAATLAGPVSVAVDAGGDLYIADQVNRRIRKVIGIAAPGLVAGQ